MTDHIALLTLQDTRREQDNNPGVHQERWAFNESNCYREKLGMLNSEYSRYGPDLSWNGLMTFERSFKQKSCWQNCAESHQRRWSMHVFVSENGGVPQNCVIFPRTWWSSDQVFITPTHVFALASMRYTVRSCSLYSKGPWAGKGCLAGGGIHNSNARRSCASAIDSWVVAAFNPRCCVPLSG